MKMNYQKPEADSFEVYSDRLLGDELSQIDTGSGEGTGDDSRVKNNIIWVDE